MKGTVPRRPENVKGMIFNIQRYAIHDGPGIRTTVFLKGCPLRCFWCQNPESQRKPPEIFLNKDNCTLCGLCVTACPEGASSLEERSATIDRAKCQGCGKCTEICPNEARRLVGKEVTVAEVMQEVLRDKKFYENSGGGITLSGGEPMAQLEFTLALLKTSKKEGLHTAIETCGLAPWSSLKKVLVYTDLVLYDLKHIDPAKHHEATGAPNELILENARRITRIKPMRIRVPLIPEFNDSLESIQATARFVRSELNNAPIDLLPYNKLGESKYSRLERETVRLEVQKEEVVQELETIIRPD